MVTSGLVPSTTTTNANLRAFSSWRIFSDQAKTQAPWGRRSGAPRGRDAVSTRDGAAGEDGPEGEDSSLGEGQR
jgi:hypothetical protein